MNSKLHELDRIDSEIIRLLYDHGRMSYAKIGEMLKLSRVAIQKRVESLMEGDVIQNFTVRLNPAKLGKTVSAFFGIEVEPRFTELVGQALANEPSVISIFQMTGPSTLHVQVLLKDEATLEQFMYNNLYALEGVVRVETHRVLKRFKQDNGLEL